MSEQRHESIGVTGAKRQSWRKANPRELLRSIVARSVGASEEEIANDCWEAIRKDDSQLRTIFEYWFANNYRSLVPESHPRRPMLDPARSATMQAVSRSIKRKIGDLVQIELLKMVLPTGKSLAESSREELLQLGGWAGRVGERLKPNQTVIQAGLTEKQLRELYLP